MITSRRPTGRLPRECERPCYGERPDPFVEYGSNHRDAFRAKNETATLDEPNSTDQVLDC